MKMRSARSFAKFTLSRQSEILRCAQDDSEGLRMKAGKRFPAACSARRLVVPVVTPSGLVFCAAKPGVGCNSGLRFGEGRNQSRVSPRRSATMVTCISRAWRTMRCMRFRPRNPSQGEYCGRTMKICVML